MQGIISLPEGGEFLTVAHKRGLETKKAIAITAYEIADAMIDEGRKGEIAC